LHAALMPGGRIDRAHRACRAWLAAGAAAELIVEHDAITFEEAAREAGVSLAVVKAAVRGPLREALIPAGHVSASEFASRAGVDVDEVVSAVRGELAPALTASGRLDLKHAASVVFASKRVARGAS
jgi:hypothetical protein